MSAYGTVNYAESYGRALSQAYPYVLNFGALYNTPNNSIYRWVNAKTIEIPSISTTGRVDSDRDTIATAQRNYNNAWETKTLTNQRKWSTLVHPMDVDQSNMVNTITNITRVFNDEQKFPEMDAYCVSKIYTDWTAQGMTANTTVPSISNVLDIFDTLMLNMDNARVPQNGRLLYVTHEIKKMLKNADTITRSLNVQDAKDAINRVVNRLDEVEIIGVESNLMKTLYDFTQGWAPAPSAQQINMMLIHPTAVITPVSYSFSQLDEPSAGSEGKYIYFEESFEDVFILNKKVGAIQFNVTASAGTVTFKYTKVANPADGQLGVAVSPVAEGWYEEDSAPGTYKLSADTTVTPSKDYFIRTTQA